MHFYAKAYEDLKEDLCSNLVVAQQFILLSRQHAQPVGYIFVTITLSALMKLISGRRRIAPLSIGAISPVTQYTVKTEVKRGQMEKISRLGIGSFASVFVRLHVCDLFADDPLLGTFMGPYGVVAQTFCLDDLTKDKREWLHFNKKLASLVL